MISPLSRLGWIVWLGAFSAAAYAQQQGLDALQWLHRIQQAAQRLNYSGTFVYLRQGGQPQTSRLTHVYEGGAERERLEVLDGAQLIVERHNDQIKQYLPETRSVVLEKRGPRGGFPGLLTEQVSGIAEQYEVRKHDVQRVAGMDCQVISLEPRDGMRYSHRLWADLGSGLLLKAQTLNEKGAVVEQIGFSQVEIGGGPERFAARLSKRIGGRDWKVTTPAISEARLAEAGWKIENPMPGFRKVLELRRGIGDVQVGQVVFSDGLASVSVFVEPLRGDDKAGEGLSSEGAVNVYRRRIADHLVTVLGEAPPACVTRIARAVEFRPRP